MAAHPNHSINNDSSSLEQAVTGFQQAVIDRIQLVVEGHLCNYSEYLSKPEYLRSGDEANAVDQQFTRYTLEWLGFDSANWTYNQPLSGKKANRPDYIVRGSIGTAFIWEDKNSTVELSEEHIAQMRRYSVGTAGYAVWCNMRRILAIRFLPSDTLKYETLVDVAIEELFAKQAHGETSLETQASNLALFQVLFRKERFGQFTKLIEKICIDEVTFEQQAIALDQSQAMKNFITGSRQSLDHLRLAALLQVREALAGRHKIFNEEASLRQEWEAARNELLDKINFPPAVSKPLLEAIEQLTARLGEIDADEIHNVEGVFRQIGMIGVGRVSASLFSVFEKWLEHALRINSALISLRLDSTELFRVAEAYQVWSERQSDKEDIKPEVFAEQVAYVFFVRLLLVRVLEDKHILRPRLASDGGFLRWHQYIQYQFKELDGIGILNENFCDLLSRKASHYYLHFLHQAVFDWFTPDDFLLVEMLEFLCRYNFNTVTSDIIGFTYEEYIDRNARNRKGHFLTRQEVVEYILDLLDYKGSHIIGRRILDPASGSGSFLVHAARRYRRALVTYFCNVHNLPDKEESLSDNHELRKALARRYLDDLTNLFFGMELNPFACYLAEMNMLIQGLDDLFILQQAGDMPAIERFHIYNTNSLDLPREVLDSTDVTGTEMRIRIPERLSDRLTDEAHAIKAKSDNHAEGFFYVVSNPPYVSSKQEEFDTKRFRNTEFFKTILSGDTNLYLLFLRLGLYYLAPYGQMIYIIPLTIFGDKSASAARKLLKMPPFSPSVAVRFYRGDILFPGVDQAVAIVRVDHSHDSPSILISGGHTVQEAKDHQATVPVTDVTEAVPQNHIWQGNWLVAPGQVSGDIWQYVKQVSNRLSTLLEHVLDATFDRKQGDVNATYLNPLRLGTSQGSSARGDVAIYKGEDVKAFAPLPDVPSDWARPQLVSNNKTVSTEVARASLALEQLKHISGTERGIVLREVARLNTRERLIATWFERTSAKPIAFTHELWRMMLKENITEEQGKALLALINSNVTAYLINLFSANNHVSKDDLGRVPIPDPQTMPIAQLANLADSILHERDRLERDFVEKYRAELPEFSDGNVYIPPSAVLTSSRVPKLTMLALVGRGEVKNYGAANGRIKALRARNLIACPLDATQPHAAAFTQVLALFLNEPERENDTWSQAQNWLLPEMVAARAWLNTYNTLTQQAQANWERCVLLQGQIDEAVANWYGFDQVMRAAIAEGLPWAKRRR